MNVSRFILLLLEALLKILLESAKSYEESPEVDSDGVPTSDEYFRQSLLCSLLRESIKDYKRSLNSCDKNETLNL